MIKEIEFDLATKVFSDIVKNNDPYEKNYGYFLDDKLVGFLSVSIIYDRAEINYIVVLEEYRRRGIAQKLFDFFLINNTVNSVSLEVREDNAPAISFYLKNGFKKASIRKNYYKDVDGILMVLEVI